MSEVAKLVEKWRKEDTWIHQQFADELEAALGAESELDLFKRRLATSEECRDNLFAAMQKQKVAPQCPRCGSYRLSCRDGHTWNIPTPASSVALEQNTSGCPLVGCSIVHPHVHTTGGPTEKS